MVMCVDSGIENDVKLWEPVAAEPCNLDNLERVMQANASNQVRTRGAMCVLVRSPWMCLGEVAFASRRSSLLCVWSLACTTADYAAAVPSVPARHAPSHSDQPARLR